MTNATSILHWRNIALLGAFFLLVVFVTAPSQSAVTIEAAACSDCVTVSGYAWSDTIGWISASCQNTSTCYASNYELGVSESTGAISGYAWSDNVGWISAESSDVSGCPSGTCAPSLDLATGKLSGWLKVLSADDPESDGWEGWISLSCENTGNCATSNYQPSADYGTGYISGYAWGGGDNVIGWIDMSWMYLDDELYQEEDTYICLDEDTLRHIDPVENTITDTTCPYAAYGYGCLDGACLVPEDPEAVKDLAALPTIVRLGDTSVISWQIQNADTCTVTGTNGDTWSGTSGSYASSALTSETVFTIVCSSDVPDTEDYTASVKVYIAPEWQEF